MQRVEDILPPFACSSTPFFLASRVTASHVTLCVLFRAASVPGAARRGEQQDDRRPSQVPVTYPLA
eukprot:1393853-Rhodomonas_salina.2